jgi:hypothetical protein
MTDIDKAAEATPVADAPAEAKPGVKTSKIVLAVWLAASLALLFLKDVGWPMAAVLLAGFLVLVWNRVDSRRHGYKIDVRAQGYGVSIQAPDAGESGE